MEIFCEGGESNFDCPLEVPNFYLIFETVVAISLAKRFIHIPEISAKINVRVAKYLSRLLA